MSDSPSPKSENSSTSKVLEEQILPLQPRHFRLDAGDILVIRHESRLSQYTIDRMDRQFKAKYPQNELMILEEGMTIDSIIKKIPPPPK